MSSETFNNSSESSESAHLILQNVTVLSELCSHLKKETKNGEDNLNSLNNLIFQAGKNVSSLQQCVESLLSVGKKLVHLSLQVLPISDPNFKCLKNEADKVLHVLEEIKYDADDQTLEARWKNTLKGNVSTKCLTIDEKYPDHCSKESLLDMSNVVSLPTVHEDIFADFNRPSRTLSSSSLKNLWKVKMCLQKMSDEDEDEIPEQKSPSSPCSSLKVECECPPVHDVICSQFHTLDHIKEEPGHEKTI